MSGTFSDYGASAFEFAVDTGRCLTELGSVDISNQIDLEYLEALQDCLGAASVYGKLQVLLLTYLVYPHCSSEVLYSLILLFLKQVTNSTKSIASKNLTGYTRKPVFAELITTLYSRFRQLIDFSTTSLIGS